MDRIIDMLVSQWLYDVSVLSQWWVIFTVFPAMIYFAFMIVKWTIITTPLWTPIVIVRNLKD
jgi:hypothetical protein